MQGADTLCPLLEISVVGMLVSTPRQSLPVLMQMDHFMGYVGSATTQKPRSSASGNLHPLNG